MLVFVINLHLLVFKMSDLASGFTKSVAYEQYSMLSKKVILSKWCLLVYMFICLLWIWMCSLGATQAMLCHEHNILSSSWEVPLSRLTSHFTNVGLEINLEFNLVSFLDQLFTDMILSWGKTRGTAYGFFLWIFIKDVIMLMLFRDYSTLVGKGYLYLCVLKFRDIAPTQMHIGDEEPFN